MANQMKAVVKVSSEAPALEDASEGARRATGEASSSVPPVDPEVVAIAQRRRFSPSDRRRILAAADRCTEPGEIGALLRREGIYSSHLATWRKQRAAIGGNERRRGRKADPALAEAHRTAKLTHEIERLRRQLAQARLIIDVQKKYRPYSPCRQPTRVENPDGRREPPGATGWLGACLQSDGG